MKWGCPLCHEIRAGNIGLNRRVAVCIGIFAQQPSRARKFLLGVFWPLILFSAEWVLQTKGKHSLKYCRDGQVGKYWKEIWTGDNKIGICMLHTYMYICYIFICMIIINTSMHLFGFINVIFKWFTLLLFDKIVYIFVFPPIEQNHDSSHNVDASRRRKYVILGWVWNIT